MNVCVITDTVFDRFIDYISLLIGIDRLILDARKWAGALV